jgi:hypothetical protein
LTQRLFKRPTGCHLAQYAVETVDVITMSLNQNHGVPTALFMDMARRKSVMLMSHG